MSASPDWIVPAWPADGVGALMTTRNGGVSAAPYRNMNLGERVADDPGAVAQNRARFADVIGAEPVYLHQVHGVRVVRLDAEATLRVAATVQADASVTTQPGLACCVQVADCLPVLFAAPRGQGVAAAHAGWRGLAAGVLEATLSELCAAARCEPSQVHCWLGPCIGPRHFEVGVDVLRAFGVASAADPDFTPRAGGKWLADLASLAGRRLRAAGVAGVHGGEWCTYAEEDRFFSYRRDGVTGRMAAAIWMHA